MVTNIKSRDRKGAYLISLSPVTSLPPGSLWWSVRDAAKSRVAELHVATTSLQIRRIPQNTDISAFHEAERASGSVAMLCGSKQYILHTEHEAMHANCL